MKKHLEEKIYSASVIIISFVLFSSLLIGIYSHKISERKLESTGTFISEHLAYVYASPNETIEATIYWCPLRLEKNTSITAYAPNLNSWVKYRGKELKRSSRGYFELQIPITPWYIGTYELRNLKLNVSIWTSNTKQKLILPFGNWSFEVVFNTSSDLLITEFNSKIFTVEEATKLIAYEIGLFNPTDRNIYVTNIAYNLNASKVRTIAIACYNATSILNLPSIHNASDIPENNILPVTGCLIPSREKRYIVVYIKVNPSVKMLLLRPKIEYKIDNRTRFMPGGIMEFTRVQKSCMSQS